MENENNRDYNPQGRNPQKQNFGGSQNNAENPTDEFNPNQVPAAEKSSPGFESGTNPDRYDSVSDGSAEGSAETFTETERYSAGNSDFAERNANEQNAELIPDSGDLEDEEEYADFEEIPEDGEDLEDETRTPGL